MMPHPAPSVPELQSEVESLRRRLSNAQAAVAGHRDQARFLANLGHQLRDPLAPIRNSVALLRLAGSDDPLIRSAQEVIDRQVRVLSRLIDNLIGGDRHEPGAAPAGPGPGRPRRILIVEDLLDSAITMEILLELLGHEVELAEDGEAALERARTFEPEIILCDIGLPGALDGYQVARLIRALPRLADTYLVALTGFSSAEDRSRAEAAGFNLHLVKPVDPATLEPLIAGIP